MWLEVEILLLETATWSCNGIKKYLHGPASPSARLCKTTLTVMCLGFFSHHLYLYTYTQNLYILSFGTSKTSGPKTLQILVNHSDSQPTPLSSRCPPQMSPLNPSEFPKHFGHKISKVQTRRRPDLGSRRRHGLGSIGASWPWILVGG